MRLSVCSVHALTVYTQGRCSTISSKLDQMRNGKLISFSMERDKIVKFPREIGQLGN